MASFSKPGQGGGRTCARSGAWLWVDSYWTKIVLTIYSLDVTVKMFVFTPSVYVKKWGNVLDASITALSIILTTLVGQVTEAGVEALRYPRLVQILFRFIMLGLRSTT